MVKTMTKKMALEIADKKLFDIAYSCLERGLVDFSDDTRFTKDEFQIIVSNGINDYLYYYADEWDVMKHYYIDPRDEDCNYQNAEQKLYDDIVDTIFGGEEDD